MLRLLRMGSKGSQGSQEMGGRADSTLGYRSGDLGCREAVIPLATEGKRLGQRELDVGTESSMELNSVWGKSGMEVAPTTLRPLRASPGPAPPHWLPLKGFQANGRNSFHHLRSCRVHGPRHCPGGHVTSKASSSPAPLAPERRLHCQAGKTQGL